MEKTFFREYTVPALVSIVVSIIIALLVPMAVSFFSPEKDIRGIINEEANLVMDRNVIGAISLYDDNASIRDEGLGKVWGGKKEIADRYRALPKFYYLAHEAIEITLSSDGQYARAIADTIGEYDNNGTIADISSNHGERWTLKKIDGKWKITSFCYDLS